MKKQIYARTYGSIIYYNRENTGDENQDVREQFQQMQLKESFIALAKVVADRMETDIEIVEEDIMIRAGFYLKNMIISKYVKERFAALVSMSDSFFICESKDSNCVAYMQFQIKTADSLY